MLKGKLRIQRSQSSQRDSSVTGHRYGSALSIGYVSCFFKQLT